MEIKIILEDGTELINSIDEIKESLRDGTLSGNELSCQVGQTKWVPLSKMIKNYYENLHQEPVNTSSSSISNSCGRNTRELENNNDVGIHKVFEYTPRALLPKNPIHQKKLGGMLVLFSVLHAVISPICFLISIPYTFGFYYLLFMASTFNVKLLLVFNAIIPIVILFYSFATGTSVWLRQRRAIVRAVRFLWLSLILGITSYVLTLLAIFLNSQPQRLYYFDTFFRSSLIGMCLLVLYKLFWIVYIRKTNASMFQK